MRTRNALSWSWLAAFVIAASCAQGSSDTSDDAGTQVGSDDAGREGIDASEQGDTAAPNPIGDDDAGGTNLDSGSSGDDDAATSEDSGSTGNDAGNTVHDAGHDSGGGTDAGSVVPTTCAEADQGYGCCVGNHLYYCTNANTVTGKTCTSGKVCGWSASKTYYDCVTAPGGSDPSGNHSIVCK